MSLTYKNVTILLGCFSFLTKFSFYDFGGPQPHVKIHHLVDILISWFIKAWQECLKFQSQYIDMVKIQLYIIWYVWKPAFVKMVVDRGMPILSSHSLISTACVQDYFISREELTFYLRTHPKVTSRIVWKAFYCLY